MEKNSDRMGFALIALSVVAFVLLAVNGPLKSTVSGFFNGFNDWESSTMTSINNNDSNNNSQNTVGPDTSVSRSHIADTATLNFDLARHPMTESDLEGVVDSSVKAGFSNISLRLGDNQNLMYKSDYLKNTNSNALSSDDIKKLVKYANSKNINIIPDLDAPSHAGAILAALSVSHPDVYASVVMENDTSTMDYSKNESITLMSELYSEVAKLFNGQSYQAMVIGGDEVPGNNDLYSNSLVPFFNKMADVVSSNKFAPILWNDSILKSDVSKLNKNLSIYYWSQAGHASGQDLIDRNTYRARVSDFTSNGINVINANDYANTYQLKNIGNTGDESYFYNYLKNTSKSSLFNEVVDGETQWWTPESTGHHGMVISLWGENSDNISSSDIIRFVSGIELPAND